MWTRGRERGYDEDPSADALDQASADLDDGWLASTRELDSPRGEPSVQALSRLC